MVTERQHLLVRAPETTRFAESLRSSAVWRRRLRALCLFWVPALVVMLPLSWLEPSSLGSSVSAQTPDLNGKWNASALRVSWSIGDWGESCGPRPSGGGDAGGLVTLSRAGGEIQLSGLGRNYRSTQCWERMPGLDPRSHSSSSSTIVTTCTMPAGDPRQARVVTTWHLRGDKIYFDEAGQYQFLVKGHNCTASVRRTRLLTKIAETPATTPTADGTDDSRDQQSPDKREGDAASLEAPPDFTAEPPPEPTRTSRCKTPGPPAQLEISPKSKLMRAGEEFRFEAIARDDRGCRVEVDASWRLVEPTDLVRVERNGRVRVPEDARSGVAHLEAAVGAQKVEVTARVVSDAQYRQLLEGGNYGALGESHESASVRLLSSEVAVGPTKQAGEKGERARALVYVVAGLTLFLALLTVWLLVRRARTSTVPAALPHDEPDSSAQAAAEPVAEEPATPAAGASKAAAPAAAIEATSEPPMRICPLCGKTYSLDTGFCGEDGARLVRKN